MKSDSELQKTVQDELTWRPGINAAHIGVAAEDGVVTLSGQVDHYAQRSRAEDAAEAVYGVKGIANEIVVELARSAHRSDLDIADAAVHALAWNVEIPTNKVTPVVHSGWVTLEGTVDWQFERDAAVRVAATLLGVKGVTNNIAIKPVAEWIDVRSKIQDAFRRNADLEARRITVESAAGTVTLTGSVASWSERDRAASAAWFAPGVANVVNELIVAR